MSTLTIHCTRCGGPAPAGERCTNGRCGKCHAQCCTGGGATSPGHYRRQPDQFTRAGNPIVVADRKRL